MHNAYAFIHTIRKDKKEVSIRIVKDMDNRGYYIECAISNYAKKNKVWQWFFCKYIGISSVWIPILTPQLQYDYSASCYRTVLNICHMEYDLAVTFSNKIKTDPSTELTMHYDTLTRTIDNLSKFITPDIPNNLRCIVRRDIDVRARAVRTTLGSIYYYVEWSNNQQKWERLISCNDELPKEQIQEHVVYSKPATFSYAEAISLAWSITNDSNELIAYYIKQNAIYSRRVLDGYVVDCNRF